jgi:hypothetical protein
VHTQTPAVQNEPPVQMVPHAPQLVLLSWVLTQTPLQSVAPATLRHNGFVEPAFDMP